MTGNTEITDQAAHLRSELDRHLCDRDRAGAVHAALAAVREGKLDIDSLYTLVLVPLLADTGAQWQSGTLQVWEEHFATATVRTIVEALYPDVNAASAQQPQRGTTVVLATPPGEHHDLGLRMLTDRLALAGWNAYFIGADTPAEQIVAAANALGADIVILSAATHFNRVLLRTIVDQVKAGLPPGARIGVGGPAFWVDRSWPADELVSETDLGLGAAGWTHAPGDDATGA